MPFSVADSKRRAIVCKQRRARTQAKQGHTDMKLKHPDWVRDAQSTPHGNYTVMDKKIKEECEKAQKRTETFERKLHEDG